MMSTGFKDSPKEGKYSSLQNVQRARFPDFKEQEKERDCTLYNEQRARFPEPQGRGKGERLYSA
jgi:hypothetical protein